jgi:hypothetical protein
MESPESQTPRSDGLSFSSSRALAESYRASEVPKGYLMLPTGRRGDHGDGAERGSTSLRFSREERPPSQDDGQVLGVGTSGPHHSITSSAVASSVGGTARLSAFAVFRLITSSCLVGAASAFISLVGAAAWPLAARAQRPGLRSVTTRFTQEVRTKQADLTCARLQFHFP